MLSQDKILDIRKENYDESFIIVKVERRLVSINDYEGVMSYTDIVLRKRIFLLVLL